MKNPWKKIRKKRIRELLPKAMSLANIHTWVIICRENANDPLAKHVGGENAGRALGLIFELKGDHVYSIALCPWGEAIGLKEMQLHDEIILIDNSSNIYDALADKLIKINPTNIAVNSSDNNLSDGLSFTQRNAFEKALKNMKNLIVSSDTLISEWLSVKTQEEIEIMRQAGKLTVEIIYDAYRRIIPGKTRDCDIAEHIRKKMIELKLGDSWSSEHNPCVNSGTIRGHAASSDKIIKSGDFIQTDFGIRVFDIWCTDYQRFAYVLPENTRKVPRKAQKYWQNAVKGNRLVLEAMKPGIRGYDIDMVQRKWMDKNGSLAVKWGTGHPVGYFAHDAGPALTGGQAKSPPEDALKILRAGQTFAFDGFFAWEEPEGQRLISVEEMAVITENGAEYLIEPQKDLFLITS